MPNKSTNFAHRRLRNVLRHCIALPSSSTWQQSHERRARNCVVRMHAKDKSETKKGEKRKKKYEQKNSGLRLEKVLEKVTRREARRRAYACKKGNEGSATCIELRSDPLGAFFRRFCAIARCRGRRRRPSDSDLICLYPSFATADDITLLRPHPSQPS